MMTNHKGMSAIRCALSLHQKLGIIEFPVDPFHIASLLQLDVKQSDFTDKNFDGCYVRYGEKAVIILNRILGNRNRMKFTLAHEIGHHVLPWHNEETFKCFNVDVAQGVKHEVEANLFASELLLPSDVFRPQVEHQVLTIEVLKKLAGMYGTSLLATAIKYTRLTKEPAVVLLVNAGRIELCSKSKTFPFIPKKNIDDFSPGDEMKMVSGASWLFDANYDTSLYEESLYFPNLQRSLVILTLTDYDQGSYL